jgi:hypothetical protein
MSVAPYAFYCVECHTHVLIEAYARRKKCWIAAAILARTRVHIDGGAA